jgi:hypothetical protein
MGTPKINFGANRYGVAVPATAKQKNPEVNFGRIGPTFAFLLDSGKDRQSGFEISNIETARGETLLVQTTMLLPERRSLIARIFRRHKEETLLILLRLKVIPPHTNSSQ